MTTLGKCEERITLEDRRRLTDACPVRRRGELCVSCERNESLTAAQWFASCRSAHEAVEAWRRANRLRAEAARRKREENDR